MPEADSPGEGRQRALFLGGLALLVVILGVFAYLITATHDQAKKDLQHRFRDRAKISAAVAHSVFASLGGGNVATPTLKAAKIDQAALDKQAKQGRSPWLVVRDASGKVIGATTGAPAEATGALRPDLQPALAGKVPLFSGVVPGSTPAKSYVEWAIPFTAGDGAQRVEIIPIPIPAMAKFLGTFLGEIPNASSATGAVLDEAGYVVGSPDKGVVAGAMYKDKALVAASKEKSSGDVDDRYFASSPVEGSTWKIVIAAETSKLYASINGSRRTIPWLTLIVLALVGFGGLVALRRAAVAQQALVRRKISRQTALEINDNVIQRLAVIKFALERGQEAATQEKVTQALKESQRLVNQLLGEEGAEAGSLRRTTDSPTDVL